MYRYDEICKSMVRLNVDCQLGILTIKPATVKQPIIEIHVTFDPLFRGCRGYRDFYEATGMK